MHSFVRSMLAPLLVLLLLCVPTVAQAGNRHAIVIGSNRGDADEERLGYAESDALRFADVLTRLGGVQHEDLTLLTGASAPAVEAALARVAEQLSHEPGMLFVYYSGHADAQGLHLGGTRLSFQTLRRLAADAGAEVTLFVVDACRSGALTRVKGAHPAQPFDLATPSPIGSEGVAILTSAAESEDAHESERLRGGIFTHHLINGLTGAADTTNDRQVTLSEAYRYAYGQTLQATTDAPSVQHPTFDINFHGHQELVLTRVDDIRDYARVRFTAPGHYVVFEQGKAGSVAAELDAIAGTGLLLAPGRYLVRRRTPDSVSEHGIVLVAGSERVIAEQDLSPIPFRETVRRGLSAPSSTFALAAGAEVLGPILPELSPTVGGVVGGQWDFADIGLQLRLRYARGSHDNGTLVTTDQLLGLDLGALHAFDLTRGLAFGLGLRVGADWYRQTFDAAGEAPTRDQVVGRLGPVARLELAPWRDVLFYLDVGADMMLVGSRTEGGTVARVVPLGGLGISVRWP